MEFSLPANYVPFVPVAPQRLSRTGIAFGIIGGLDFIASFLLVTRGGAIHNHALRLPTVLLIVGSILFAVAAIIMFRRSNRAFDIEQKKAQHDFIEANTEWITSTFIPWVRSETGVSLGILHASILITSNFMRYDDNGAEVVLYLFNANGQPLRVGIEREAIL